MAPAPAVTMNSIALMEHSWHVITGRIVANDYKKAQPVGQADTLIGFVEPMLIVFVLLYVACCLIEMMGTMLARAGGLKGGKVVRFSSSFLELWYYSMSLIIAYQMYKDMEWIWPKGWGSIMHDGRVQNIKGLPPYFVPAETKFYYLLELSWTFGCSVRLLTRKRKKDFWEMFCHHVVTSLLISMSYSIGYVRVGIVVLIIHNSFDPLLHLAKCSHYLKIPVIPDISFVCCAIIFAAMRLYWYPVMKNSILTSGVQGDVRSDSEDEEEPPSPAHKPKKH